MGTGDNSHHLDGPAGLAERVLRVRMAKQQALRLSGWEDQPLSRAQAEYAALDAFACLRIHEVRRKGLCDGTYIPILSPPCQRFQ